MPDSSSLEFVDRTLPPGRPQRVDEDTSVECVLVAAPDVRVLILRGGDVRHAPRTWTLKHWLVMSSEVRRRPVGYVAVGPSAQPSAPPIGEPPTQIEIPESPVPVEESPAQATDATFQVELGIALDVPRLRHR